MPHTFLFRIALASVCLATIACGGTEAIELPAVTPKKPPRIAFTSGGGQTDTIEAVPRTPIIITVTDSTGRPRSGSAVTLYLVGPTDPVARFHSNASTDAQGTATVSLKFGSVPGVWTLRATEFETGFSDSLRFTVTPGQPVRVTASPRDSAAFVGAGYRVRTVVTDRRGNVVASAGASFAVDSGTTASIGADGRINALAIGRARMRVRLDNGATDTVRISVVPSGVLAVSVEGSAFVYGLARVNLDGSGLRMLHTGSSVLSPAWSPNGEFIAFSLESAILYRVDTSGVKTKLSSLGAMPWEGMPRYSNDGRYIYFTGGSYPDNLDTYRMAADGSGPRTLVTPRRTGNMRYWNASPSPDGGTLAYSHGGFSLHLTTPASGVERLLATPAGGDLPRFSPDGVWIAFLEELTRSIKIVRPDGTGLRQVTPPGIATYFGHDWSPDGAWIIYRTLLELRIVRVSDGLTLPLPYSEPLTAPAWRPL